MSIPKNGGRPTKGGLTPPKSKDTGMPLGPKNKSLPKRGNFSKSPSKGKGRGSAESTARRLTDIAVDREVKDLKSQRREVSRTARHAKKEVRNQYRRGMGDLEAVHSTTGGFIDAQNTQAQAGFDAARVEQNAAAAALQSQLQNVYAAGEGSATAEMARLGLTGATSGSGFLGQLASDRANSASVGAQTSSNNLANLGLAQSNAGAVGQLLAGMNQGSYLSGVGANLNRKNDQMDELRTEELNQKNLVREAIRDAQSSRKDTFFQLLTQLKQSGWGRR